MPFCEPQLKSPSYRKILTAGGLEISLLTLTFTLPGAMRALVLAKRRLCLELGDLRSSESLLNSLGHNSLGYLGGL